MAILAARFVRWAPTILLLLGQSVAKTVTYDFNVTWVTANPDNATDRKVIGINGQWPLPIIEVDRGDQLVVNMYNGLGDKNATIHFHGMYQNGTNEMDGASMVTQCPVGPGSSITYNFTVNQNGTYWYHCHTDFCYPDGYRQALIVHDSDAYFHNMYKEEFTVTLSDWYHELVEGIAPDFLSVYNPKGSEPIPDSFLFNDTLGTTIAVQPNTTYLLRILNVGAFVSQYFYIEEHNFTIVEIDGVYVEPTEAEILLLGVAQRYAVLFTTKNTTDQNYAIVTISDSITLDTIPPDLTLNLTNWLLYNSSAPLNPANITVDVPSDLDPFDDFTLVPHDQMPLLPEPDYEFTTSVIMANLNTGDGYAFFDNISYTMPKVPTIFSTLSGGNLSNNAAIYGEFTHSMVLNHLDVVQMVINNEDTGAHPFHLHGHNFQIITRDPAYGPTFYDYKALPESVEYDPDNHTAFPAIPARRDTVILPPMGNIVIRFVADNPGIWLFHCHIDWHLSQGLAMQMIEAPTQMQERLTIPQNHYDVCKAVGVPFAGNAAANTKDFLDLTGQNVQPGWLPGGFTARGIVALVFSCISAFVGIAFIIVYGMSDLKFRNDSNMASSVEVVTPKKTGTAVEMTPVSEYHD